ncbi:MAG: tetratricopeptide repeat protein, partial [Eudoraea sp.]|nr:tetratricopeptide repeat protein [Eudoraea sp.]
MPSKPALFPALSSWRKKEVLMLFLILFWGMLAFAQNARVQQLQDSIAYLRSQPQFSEKDTTHINLLNELAVNLRYYNLDNALKFAKQALELSREAEYPHGESIALLRIGDYYSDNGQSDEAINKFKQALEIADNLEDKLVPLRIVNNLASEYTYKGDFAKALNGYLDGLERINAYLKIEENKEILTFQSIMNENIASLFASQKDFEQSLKYYENVRKINTKIGDPVIMAETNSNLASVYAEKGASEYAEDKDFEYAMFHVNSSIKTFEEKKIMDWLAYAYEVKGKIHLNKNNYKWALHWYRQSEFLHENLQDDRAKIDLYNGLAQVHLKLNEDKLAEKYAMDAYEISNRINDAEGTTQCAKTLYEVHKNSGNFTKALGYLEIYQDLSSNMYRNENKKSLVLIKTQAEYNEKNNAIMEANEKALAKRDRYVWVSMSIFLVLLVLILLIHRNQKIQKRLNGVLNAKKELLEKRESELKDNNETKTKLFSIIGHDLRGPIGALQGLLNMFSEGDISKKEFMEFLPKLRGDVDHIYFTLNNLLSWGHSQLNGSVTKPEVTALENIVAENINLLTEQAQNKSIRIVNELPENTNTWADANQIDIVIRNLMSNALKFTPDNGLIKISGEEYADHWQISVRDTGVGMDQATVD